MKPTRDDPTAVGTSEVADAIIEKLGGCGVIDMSGRHRSRIVGAGHRRRGRATARGARRGATTRTSCSSTSRRACRRARRSTSTRWAPSSASSRRSSGTNGYDETAGSDVVVITAGLPRQPGMSRDDLVTTNEKIVGSVTEQVVAAVAGRDPDRRLEPARRDVPRREERLRASRRSASSAWPGSSTRRASRTFIAWETGASVKDVQAIVLGGHGDQMVPGRLGDDRRRRAADEARLRRTGSRRWSSARARAAARSSTCSARRRGTRPARRRAQMVDAIVLDEKRVLPCTALPRGRVRHRRALHGRAGEARRGRDRGDRRARARRRGARQLDASADAVRDVVGVLSRR